MAQYLAEEHLNSEGEPDKKSCAAIRKCPCKKKPKLDIKVNPGDKAESSDDSDFISISSDSDSLDESSKEEDLLTNAEVRKICSSNYICSYVLHSACQYSSY